MCSCLLSDLAFEWKWGRSWPCFETNLPAFHMLIMLNKNWLAYDWHMKSRKVCIKTKSTPASLSLKGQGTKHTTVKWSIINYKMKLLFWKRWHFVDLPLNFLFRDIKYLKHTQSFSSVRLTVGDYFHMKTINYN